MASELDRAIAVMDRLRSPGGCPWDAAQTSETLTRYLLEETYEVLEAIETNNGTLLREELGDLLLQVLFHARIATELPGAESFSIEEVAGDLADKLIRRHPHVFEQVDGAQTDLATLNERWERQKIAEKARTSAVDGVPIAQPALALAAKLIARAKRAGLTPSPAPTNEVGERLFAIVQQAVAAGIDPEASLRRTTRAYRNAILAVEATSTTS